LSRPLMQNGISELERMFETGSADPRMLEALAHELSFRSVPRAATLLSKVRRAAAGTSGTLTPNQQALFEHRTSVGTQCSLLSPQSVQSKETVAESTEVQVQPSLSIEEACKVLKVSSNASWDTIEHARRAIVEMARPDRLAKENSANCQVLRQEACLANAALHTLLQMRRAR
jgi:DnaJ-domain-containing protein 1